MSVRTQQSLTGFIASDPQLSFTSQGYARFYARVGQEQFTRLEDGSFEKTGTEFTDLVQYRKAAERAFAQFQKGDSFVAEGYTQTYERHLQDGQVENREEFVAKKLGHDTARTTYEVDRSPRRDQTVDPSPSVAVDRRPARSEAPHSSATQLAL